MMMIFIGTQFCNLHRDANGLHLRQKSEASLRSSPLSASRMAAQNRRHLASLTFAFGYRQTAFCVEPDDTEGAGLREEPLSSRWGEYAGKQAKQVQVQFLPLFTRFRCKPIWANELIPYSVGMIISIRGTCTDASYRHTYYKVIEVAEPFD